MMVLLWWSSHVFRLLRCPLTTYLDAMEDPTIIEVLLLISDGRVALRQCKKMLGS